MFPSIKRCGPLQLNDTPVHNYAFPTYTDNSSIKQYTKLTRFQNEMLYFRTQTTASTKSMTNKINIGFKKKDTRKCYL